MEKRMEKGKNMIILENWFLMEFIKKELNGREKKYFIKILRNNLSGNI